MGRRVQIHLIDILNPQLKRRSKADYAREDFLRQRAKNIHARTHQLKDRIKRILQIHEAITVCRRNGMKVNNEAILEYLCELRDIRDESVDIYKHRVAPVAK